MLVHLKNMNVKQILFRVVSTVERLQPSLTSSSSSSSSTTEERRMWGRSHDAEERRRRWGQTRHTTTTFPGKDTGEEEDGAEHKEESKEREQKEADEMVTAKDFVDPDLSRKEITEIHMNNSVDLVQTCRHDNPRKRRRDRLKRSIATVENSEEEEFKEGTHVVLVERSCPKTSYFGETEEEENSLEKDLGSELANGDEPNLSEINSIMGSENHVDVDPIDKAADEEVEYPSTEITDCKTIFSSLKEGREEMAASSRLFTPSLWPVAAKEDERAGKRLLLHRHLSEVQRGHPGHPGGLGGHLDSLGGLKGCSGDLGELRGLPGLREDMGELRGSQGLEGLWEGRGGEEEWGGVGGEHRPQSC